MDVVGKKTICKSNSGITKKINCRFKDIHTFPAFIGKERKMEEIKKAVPVSGTAFFIIF